MISRIALASLFEKLDVDLDLSYFHVGVGAGTRF